MPTGALVANEVSEGEVRPSDPVHSEPASLFETKASWRHTAVAVCAIASAGLLSYWFSFKGAFIYDEYPWIIDNLAIRHLWPPWKPMLAGDNASRPLIGLLDAIDYQISGFEPWSYHLVNLLIHICAGLALYGIVRRTLLSRRLNARFGKDSFALGLIVALIWLVHPLQTQSVTYVMQRCESAMGMFYLVCLYSSIRSFESKRKRLWYACAIAASVGGMLSKQVMVTAPVMVLLYDWVFATQSLKTSLKKRWALYAGLAATWAVLAVTVIISPVNMTAGFAVKSISSLDYFKTQLGVILYYLRLSLWPNRLCLDYLGWP
ncbi:MAG TPA: glycosyltransferase family 39 protein, partial [Blastocatellia bacterium]